MRGRCYGRLDVGLSPEGRRQARELGAALRDCALAAVYSSPLVRALDNRGRDRGAARAGAGRGERLREIDFGELEGLPYEEIEAERPELFREWMESPSPFAFPGARRSPTCAPECCRRWPGSAGGTRARSWRVVAHGGVDPGSAGRRARARGRSAVPSRPGVRRAQRRRLGGRNAGRGGGERRPILARMRPPATAVVLTVGNEIVFGDVENTNASWLARRLAELGLEVRLLAAVRDSVEEVAAFLRAEMGRTGVVIVTGGLGGTPDDITREAVAAAFDVPTEEIPELAEALRRRFGARGLGDYAARWACIPQGAVPAREPARRRARLRPRQRPRPARAPAGDGGDVRDACRPLPRASRSAPGGAGTRPARGRSSRSSRRRPSATRR